MLHLFFVGFFVFFLPPFIEFIAMWWWQLKYVLLSPRKLGEDEPILTTFQGLKPPTRLDFIGKEVVL